MHPAYSVIFFTTASGAGYGLLVWLAAAVLGGDARLTPALGLAGLVVALVLITGGLLSSTFHLGRPERAWRAISQWRTSWLSREGVLALVTFAPALALGAGLAFGDGRSSWVILAALAAIVLGVATVWSTGMIYQSLTTIRAWSDPIVAPIYVLLALASGLGLFQLLVALAGPLDVAGAAGAAGLLGCGALAKLAYWRRLDTAPRTLTAGAATGLGGFGAVRVLDPPHTLANYVQREMGYAVARRHAARLRRLAVLFAFLLPGVLLVVASLLSGAVAAAAAIVAVASMAFGLVTERWLFFAEAQHAVTLFYGADRA